MSRRASDIAEEIGRLVDYNTLPKTFAQRRVAIKTQRSPPKYCAATCVGYLTGAGYSEILTYSFYDEKLLALSGVKESEHIYGGQSGQQRRTSICAPIFCRGCWPSFRRTARYSRATSFVCLKSGKIFRKSQAEKWQLAVGLIDVTQRDEVLFRCLRGLEPAAGEITIYPKGQALGMRFPFQRRGVLLVDLDDLLKTASDERRKFKKPALLPANRTRPCDDSAGHCRI